MSGLSVTNTPLVKFKHGDLSRHSELLAVEEPLEMVIQYGTSSQRKQKTIAITMRTPGQDLELMTGFLYAEGIIKQLADLVSVRHCVQAENPQNTVKAVLAINLEVPVKQLERHFYISSSCGVCGKASLESLAAVCPWDHQGEAPKLNDAILRGLPEALRSLQSVYQHTGGVHAAALFDAAGQPIAWREDVGRHNALDKLIGLSWHQQLLPWSDNLLVLSGRISYELMQKAVMAGARTVIAMGAPSSLAVELAREFQITLVGFLKENSYNIYHQN